MLTVPYGLHIAVAKISKPPVLWTWYSVCLFVVSMFYEDVHRLCIIK